MSAFDHVDVTLTRALAGWRFPVFLLSCLAFFTLLVGVIVLAPTSGSASGSFADAFRVWCFGYDPATGAMQWVAVGTMLTQPFLLAGFVLAVWAAPLRLAVALPLRATAPVIASALAVVIAVGAGMVFFNERTEADARPLDVADLRTALPAPRIELTSHERAHVSLTAERGRVVLLTAVYASCGQACPMIMEQVKRVVASVPDDDRADLRVLCVTLDPEHDTPEVLAGLARLQKVAAPLYRLLTGAPEDVNRVLDDMNVARKRDPKTGIIDHANMFVIIDRKGTLAYRYGLGEQQERWLSTSLTRLLRERPPAQ